LHTLNFCVVLLFLHRRRIDDLVVLLLQIIQYFFNFTRRAFNLFVKLTALLNRRNSSIGSSKKG
jgi:hypothetical protein